ncbi:MAG: sigma-54-dependent Fis family transcriptional regulator [Planctomycetes bacterium]|nr:sigma-54-dependent Fis family transcriptional regulator [Planctomycetota bacterium]MCB9869312.1 sigma-54-dependent Fis family transcriptional regulator [Planctomycetota bacterium]
MSKARVIVADDEESMRYFVTRTLGRHGYDAVAAGDGEDAVRQFDTLPADVAVVDLKMPGLGGLAVLQELRRRDPEVIVIVMTAFGTVESAVQAMKGGAYDYISKPFDEDELLLILERALAHRTALRENRDLRRMVDHRSSYAGLIGQSPAMKSVYQAIEALQDSDATVLITGESGTGKELVARAIHMGSRRRSNPFIPVPCAALMDNLVDSELFGHVPGAFTGARQHKRGLIARAQGGTLFLDEIAQASMAMQTKLERFLQEREFTPVGGTESTRVDVRIIAATNQDLASLVASGQVRRELFFRLNVIPVQLPPLRARREDIQVLCAWFLEQVQGGSARIRGLSARAMLALSSYDWPGNVRELQNVVERLAALNPEKELLTVEDLPIELRPDPSALASIDGPSVPASYHEMIAAAERDYFRDLLQHTAGNVTEAAKVAGMSRGHLYRKLKQLGIDTLDARG